MRRKTDENRKNRRERNAGEMCCIASNNIETAGILVGRARKKEEEKKSYSKHGRRQRKREKERKKRKEKKEKVLLQGLLTNRNVVKKVFSLEERTKRDERESETKQQKQLERESERKSDHDGRASNTSTCFWIGGFVWLEGDKLSVAEQGPEQQTKKKEVPKRKQPEREANEKGTCKHSFARLSWR
jgi:hypothetical protein